MKDGYGMKSKDLLMKYDPQSSSWKMSQTSSEQAMEKPLTVSSKVWPKCGIIDLNGNLYQQNSLEQGTKDKDGWELESWETPNTMDYLEPRSGEALERALYRGDPEKKSKRKSTGNLRENPKLWLTPTTMDKKDDSLKHATKLMQGKTIRNSGQRVQRTLSDQVWMEMIEEDPTLMRFYQDHEMVKHDLWLSFLAIHQLGHYTRRQVLFL